MANTVKRADTQKTIQIIDLLREVCSKDDSGRAVYKEGYSDAEVGRKLDVSHFAVGRIRRELFGELHRQGGPIRLADVRDKLKEVEEALDEIDARLQSLERSIGSHAMLISKHMHK